MKLSTILARQFNQDVLHSGLNLFWRIVSGPVTLLLVPFFTTPEIQGYWYTFVSLAALRVFADLGLTAIVTQFVAHEFAFLTFGEDHAIHGEPDHLASTGALLRFVIRWAILSALVIFPVMFALGFYLFVQKGETGVWLLPWIILLCGTLVNYWGFILGAFIQGERQVARTQRISFISRVIQTCALFALLIGGAGLYSLAIATTLGGVALMVMLVSRYSVSLRQLISVKSDRRWGRPVLKLMWRYALTWAGSYLNMQLFTPLAFQFRGAIVAGKVGITMAVWYAVLNLSTTWFTANVPKLNVLVERREERKVGLLMRELLLLTVATFIVGTLVIVGILYGGTASVFSVFEKLLNRMMTLRSTVFLLCANLISIIVFAMGAYIRAHMEEPYYLPTLVSGLATAGLSVVLIQRMGPEAIFVGLFLSTVALLPWFAGIYRRKRAIWAVPVLGNRIVEKAPNGPG